MRKKLCLLLVLVLCACSIGCGDKSEETAQMEEVGKNVDEQKEEIEQVVDEEEPKYVKKTFNGITLKYNDNYTFVDGSDNSSFSLIFENQKAIIFGLMMDFSTDIALTDEMINDLALSSFFSKMKYEDLVEEKITFNELSGIDASCRSFDNGLKADMNVRLISKDGKVYVIAIVCDDSVQKSELYYNEYAKMIESIEFVGVQEFNKVDFKNDDFSFSYNENNFTVDENEVGVGIYTKIPDNGESNSILIFMSQENTEFDSTPESDIEKTKKIICEEVCKGLFEIKEGIEIIDESYENGSGFFMELSDGTKCYARIMSYGKQLSLAISRLCPYSDSVNDELFEVYISAKSYIKEELPEKKTPSTSDSNYTKEEDSSKVKNDNVQENKDPETKAKSNETENKTEDSPNTTTVTTGQKNALNMAGTYLDIMAFSYSGLIEQLKYEKYSTEEATYAADNCGADWNEQAAKKGKQYMDIMSFSKEGLIDQLIFDGFTREQATYGAESNGY